MISAIYVPTRFISLINLADIIGIKGINNARMIIGMDMAFAINIPTNSGTIIASIEIIGTIIAACFLRWHDFCKN